MKNFLRYQVCTLYIVLCLMFFFMYVCTHAATNSSANGGS